MTFCSRYVAEILAALREGTLYPLLSKLRRDGLLRHDWRESPSGPRDALRHYLDDARRELRSDPDARTPPWSPA
ncbi:MAG TPA: helix-turn-helix transcriptional regulator [Asanoa sp.]|nr:helix-turn-helix transcriptional regulator [Asanoa sp.]